MKSTELPALAELRESLREAAARDVAARKPRRWRRRGIGLLVAALFTGAAAAGAADLISSGEPVNDEKAADSNTRYGSSGQLQIAVKAPDKPLPWGVQIYTSPEGQKCALLGRIRGAELGKLDADGKTFHPFTEGRGGACGDPDTSKLGYFRDLYPGKDRSVVFGRAKAGVKRVIFEFKGERVPAETGLGGAFVIVFSGSANPPIVALD
jgi:hypothetical protein